MSSEAVQAIMRRHEIEHEEDWRGYVDTMPWISFPADWQIQVIPPFAGAVARFRVKLPNDEEKSIYFDAHDRLGYEGEPYWEVYPVRGENARCLAEDIPELLRLIAEPRD